MSDNTDQMGPNYRPTSYSPPLPTLFSNLSLDASPVFNSNCFTSAEDEHDMPMLNSKFSPTNDKEYEPPKYWPTSLSLDPHKDAPINERGHSENALKFHYRVSYPLPDVEERCRHAEIALKYYNKENSSNYHLVDAFLSNGVSLWDGTWFHCNFTAKPPSSEVSPKLFYAEVCGSTGTVRGCFVLQGKTTVGCDLCSNVVHPTHGDVNESLTIKRSGFEPLALSEAEKCRRQAEAALEYYNKKNASKYELVDAVLSNKLWLDDTCFHCNFTAKIPYLDIPPKLFFAEIIESWISCCLILQGKTTSGCIQCFSVIHPLRGFDHGNCNMEMYSPTMPLFPSPTAIDTSSYQTLDRYGKPQTFGPDTVNCNPLEEYAENALWRFNRDNGTSYTLVDTLRCCDLLSDGCMYHINFTAKEPEGDMFPKRFFAEICGEFWTAISYAMLEGQPTMDGCMFCCSEIIHPTHGFHKGLPESPNIY